MPPLTTTTTTSGPELKQDADAAMKAGDYVLAAQLYMQALAGQAQQPDVRAVLLANCSLAHLKLQQPQQALAAAEQALALRPRWGKAHLRLGQALEAAGDDVPSAVRSLRRAAELDNALAEAAGRHLAALEQQVSRSLCRVTLHGKGGAVYAAAVHPQVLHLGSLPTRLLVTACASGNLEIWCSATATGSAARASWGLLQTLTGHTESATAVAWSPCGCWVASGSLDHTALLWRVELPKCWRPLGPSSQHPEQVQPEGRSSREEAEQPRTPQPPPALPATGLLAQHATLAGHTGRVVGLAFSPDSSLLVTTSTDGSLRLWATANGSCLRQLAGHSALVTSVCFSPCGRLLASASGDTHCRIWGVPSGECLHDIDWESGGVTHCCFVSAATPAAAAAAAEPEADQGADDQEATAAAPNLPSWLVTCHIQLQRREGRILLWDLQRRQHGWVDGRLCAPCTTIDGPRGQVTSLDCCALVGGGRGTDEGPLLLLAAACADGTLRVYELSAGGSSGRPPPASLGPAESLGSPPAAAGRRSHLPSAPAQRVAAGARAAAPLAPVPLFEVPLEQEPQQPTPWSVPGWSAVAMHQAVHARNLVRFSPGGDLLAASGPDRAIRVFDVESGEEVRTLRGHSKAVRVLCWLGLGELLSAGEDGRVKIWKVGHVRQREEPKKA